MEILGIRSLLFLSAFAIAVYLLCLVRKKWKAIALERSSLLAAHQMFKDARRDLEAKFEKERIKISDELRQFGEKKRELDKEFSSREVQLEKLEILKNEGIRKQLQDEKEQLTKDSVRLEGERQSIAEEWEKLKREKEGLHLRTQQLEQERLELTELRQNLNEEGTISTETPSHASQKAKTKEASDAKQKGHLYEIMRPETDRTPQQAESEKLHEPKSIQALSQTSEAIPLRSPESEEESEE